MKAMYYIQFFENLKHKKVRINSMASLIEILPVLARAMRVSQKETEELLNRKPLYLFTDGYSIKWSNNKEAFENSLFREVKEDEILHTPLIRPYYTDEIAKAVKEHGVLLEHGEEYVTILSVFNGEVTIYDIDRFRKFAPYEMAMYFRFADGTPFGVPVTLQEALEL